MNLLIEENTEESNKRIIDNVNNSPLSKEYITPNGENMLHWAGAFNNISIMEFVIDKIHVNLLNHRGSSALYYACMRNSVEAVKLLLKYHANPKIESAFSGKFPVEITTNDEIKNLLNEYDEKNIPLDKNHELRTGFSRYTSYKYRKYMWWLSNLNYYFSKDNIKIEGTEIIDEARSIFRQKGIEGLNNKCQKLCLDFINDKKTDCCLYCSVSDKKLLRCSKCKEVLFCDVVCQRKASTIHKEDCQN
jgi:hypothetical protein